MVWTSQCAARSAASGKRCCLLVGHRGLHATPGEAFEETMCEGQIAFALRVRLELAATVRPLAGAEAVPDVPAATPLMPKQRRILVRRFRAKRAGLRAGAKQAGGES